MTVTVVEQAGNDVTVVEGATRTVTITDEEGTVTTVTVGLNGPKGEKGEPGDPGIQGPPGDPGVDGSDGASAYQVAVANGFVGTEAEWLISLEGDAGLPGTDGLDGESAYQLAVDNGFVGTETEWLASLVGAKGDPGDPGPAGVVQSIVPGANITVDNTDPANPIVASTGGTSDGGAPVGLILLKKIVLSIDTPTVTFPASDLPTTGYDHLELVVVGRSTTAGTGQSNLLCSFNGDTNDTNYLSLFQYATTGQNVKRYIGTLSALGASAPAVNRALIPNYRDSARSKTSLSEVSYGGSGGRVGQQSLMWNGTAPITTIDLTVEGGVNFAAGTTVELYGISSAVGGSSGSATKLDDLSDVDLTTTPPTDGQTMVYDAASGLWVPGAGGGAGIVLVPGTGMAIDNTDPSHPIISLATIDTIPSITRPQDDEFNDTNGMSGPVNGLNAKWLRKNMDPSWGSLSDDAFYFNIPSGQAAVEAIYQAAPSGDFRISSAATRIACGDRQMWGLFVVDSAGSGIGVMFDDPSGDPSTRFRTPSAWNPAPAAIGQTISSSMNNAWTSGVKLYMSLRKEGNVYLATAGIDSDTALVALFSEVIATPTAFVPAYVGFGRWYGTSTAQIKLDWFRASW